MYAHKNTPSMERAINITKERRIKQDRFNQENGIKPTTVTKKISSGIIDSLKKSGKSGKIEKKAYSFDHLSEQELDKKIKELKKLMSDAVSKLEFEEAAKLRDQIKELSDIRLIL